MSNSRRTEIPTCPICASRRVAQAAVMRSDYRCPDCSALFDAGGRVIADPRPWVDPRTRADRATRNGTEPDDRTDRTDRSGSSDPTDPIDGTGSTNAGRANRSNRPN